MVEGVVPNLMSFLHGTSDDFLSTLHLSSEDKKRAKCLMLSEEREDLRGFLIGSIVEGECDESRSQHGGHRTDHVCELTLGRSLTEPDL